MFKKLLLAAVAATATLLPAGAEVQPGTFELMETIDSNGVLVTVNHPDCVGSGTYGSYRWMGMKREMRLCPGDVIDPVDHNTVRHEAIHAIQHCVNVARGTSTDNPVNTDVNDLMSWAREHLTDAEIRWIKRSYDKSQWLTEIEAFAGAEAFTASEIQEMFLDACTVRV